MKHCEIINLKKKFNKYLLNVQINKKKLSM